MSTFFLTLSAWRGLGRDAIPAPTWSRTRWWRDGAVHRSWVVARVER